MDYRHSSKGKSHLHLSAKRIKASAKIKVLLEKIASKSKPAEADLKLSTHETFIRSNSVDLNAPSTSQSTSNDQNAILPVHPSSLPNVSNSNTVNKKRKLTLSKKRRKVMVNSGLVNWKIVKKGKTSQTIGNVNVENINPNSDDNVILRTRQEDLRVYDFEDTPSIDLTTASTSAKLIQKSIANTDIELHEICCDESAKNLEVEIACHDPSRDLAINTITGRFLIDGQHFLREIRSLENHHNMCLKSSKGYFKLMSWTTQLLVWNLQFECPYCKTTKVVTSEAKSEPKINVNKTAQSTLTPKADQLSVADSAVWGIMSIGGGHSNMEELFSTMGVKPIDIKSFQKTELKLGKVWQEMLYDSMIDSGKQEKLLAVNNGDVTADGTPFITVVVDGGWCHRSYGHRYSSNSGEACVIGAKTKKLLHLGIRNKYCSMCLHLKKNGKDEVHEHCFKNWSGTSCGMESDMLVQAFNQSKAVHGLEYRRFIGDGDSSVHKKLNEMVSYGRNIEKIECTNHVIKNYTKALMKIPGVSRNVRSILPRPTVKRLVKGARSAIIYNSKNGQNPINLRDDLKNGPSHIFGMHSNCKKYFCTSTTDEEALEGNRLQAFNYVQECLKPVVRKAHQLVTNSTSNYAENFMSLVAKFSGGKQVNRCKRGSYTIRAQGAALDYQMGPSWHYETMKKVLGRSSSVIIKHRARRITNKILRTRKCLFAKIGPRKRLQNDVKGKEDYGEKCQKLDLDPQEFENEAIECQNSLQVSVEKRDLIEKTTRGQSDNETWFSEREKRLTASMFGQIAKRRKTSKWNKLVETLLYAKPFSNAAVQYGKLHEKCAIKTYTERTGEKVTDCGLFVDLKYGYLGASPDGLTDSGGIIEVKCPKKAENLTIKEAIATIKSFCLDKNGRLKKTHNYYYQVQGQLHVTGKQYCDFIVWTPKDVYVERILPDNDFWNKMVLPKLKFFFEKAVLPEIVDPRKCRSMEIREPDVNLISEYL